MLFSVGWTPCVGAFLGSALMMASTEGKVIKGSILLLCYSIGLGIPFIISSILIEKLKKVFSWIKENYKLINTISGIFLIIIGIVMIGQVILNKIEIKNDTNELRENILNEEVLDKEQEGGNIMNITSQNFEQEVLKSDMPVLVDFWASWCGPCKMMSPVVEEIAKEMEGKAKVCKINVDDEQDLAIRYGIMSIPTFLVFKDGKVVNSTLGVQDKEVLKNLLK